MVFVLLLYAAQGLGQLIGARGAATAAVDALEARYGLVYIHSAHKRRYALRIAVAATDKLNVLDGVALGRDDDGTRAGARSDVLRELCHDSTTSVPPQELLQPYSCRCEALRCHQPR